MKKFASQLGGKLGVGLCAAGFLAVFMGWNGAASVDRVPAQFPYLISGGLLGLCLIVCGIGLLVIQNQRADRAELQATLRELRQAMADAGLAQPDQGAQARKEFERPAKRPTPPQYRVDSDAGAAAAEPTVQMQAVEADDIADGSTGDEGDDGAPKKRRRRSAPIRAE